MTVDDLTVMVERSRQTHPPAVRADISLPNFGAAPSQLGLVNMARVAVAAGFTGLWVSDHVVLIDGSRSRYPFHPDGKFLVAPREDWYEALVSLSYLGALFPGVELGISVLIPALRNPLELAKQLATLDQLTGGRIRLGVGSGWLREEFEALEVPYAGRGARMDAALDLLRACWTGSPPAGVYGPYKLRRGVCCEPRPVSGEIPILVGGTSHAAIKRAVRVGHGWHGIVPAQGIAPEDVGAIGRELSMLCAEAGRPFRDFELSLRMSIAARQLGTPELIGLLRGYVENGVTRFVIDIGWRSLEDAERRLAQLRADLDEVSRCLMNSGPPTRSYGDEQA